MAESLQIPIEPFSWSGLELEQTFRLVEKYIPIKVCRNHGLIPLKFHDHCLTLGIVDPSNPNIHLIIKKLSERKNLSLSAQKLDSKTFQLLLSSYLNYKQTNGSSDKSRKQKANTKPNQNDITPSPEDSPQPSTFVISDESAAAATIAPAEMTPIVVGPVSNPINSEDRPTSIYEENPEKLHNQMRGNDDDRPTLNNSKQEHENSLSIPSVHVPYAPVQLREGDNLEGDSEKAYNRLNLTAKHINKPLESLINLPAKQLWQEVLGRILSKGIGRLYFENHGDEGRILLSESGVMKEALYGLTIKTFYGILNEFKRLAHIPPMPVIKARKAEMEQYYLDERILLRLTIMPGKYGDEGTLQILRGQALVFHQKKQMDDQGREALQIAQQLERKLRHIYLRSQINPSPISALPELLAACDRLKTQLENIRTE